MNYSVFRLDDTFRNCYVWSVAILAQTGTVEVPEQHHYIWRKISSNVTKTRAFGGYESFYIGNWRIRNLKGPVSVLDASSISIPVDIWGVYTVHSFMRVCEYVGVNAALNSFITACRINVGGKAEVMQTVSRSEITFDRDRHGAERSGQIGFTNESVTCSLQYRHDILTSNHSCHGDPWTMVKCYFDDVKLLSCATRSSNGCCLQCHGIIV